MLRHLFTGRRALACLLSVLAVGISATAIAQTYSGLAATSVTEPIDFNQATEAQLDGLRGVGPATTRRILQARDQQRFSDWADLIRRVRGIGHVAAASFSAQGFVVNGAPYVPASGATAEPPAPAPAR